MTVLSRRHVLPLIGAATLPLWTAPGLAATTDDRRKMKVFKTPLCGCCGAWVDHMRDDGFDVTVTDMDDLTPVKQYLRVRPELQSCHTATVFGYVIEGHVPAEDVKRLISERPNALGLAVPGMPVGSPGMEQGDRRDRYDVVLFTETDQTVFSTHN